MEKQATARAMNAVFTHQVPKERYLDDDGFVTIPGFENRYAINRKGDIIGPKGPMKPHVSHRGYLKIIFKIRGVCRNLFVHRLVAMTFIPPKSDNLQVNHINENKLDNRVENLEWCTAKYNSNHGTRNKRASQTKRQRIGRPMAKCTKDGEVVETFACLAEAIDKYPSFSSGTIGRCLNGRAFSSYGFIWKYLDCNAS